MKQNDFYESETISKAYTAKKLLDNSYLILAQVASVYRHKGMVFPVICSSTLVCLDRNGPTSVTEIAKTLGHPHQTVAQHLRTLLKLEIIEKRADENDRRRTEYHLTHFGVEQAACLSKYNIDAALVFRGLDEDLGVDLGAILDASYAHLKRRTMSDRFADLTGLKEKT